MYARHMKNFLSLPSLIFIIAIACLGCEPKQAPNKNNTTQTSNTSASTSRASSTSETTPAETTEPVSTLPPGVIARGSGFTVTVEDFAQTMKRSLLFAPDEILKKGGRLPEAQLKEPFVQSRITESLVARHVAEAEAKKRGIDVSPQEVNAFIAEDSLLKRFKSSENTTNPPGATYDVAQFGLTWQDVELVAREQLLATKIDAALIAELTEEEVWEAWKFAHDTVDIFFIRLDNTPTSDEIDAVVENEKDAIERHFKENPKDFLTPMLTNIDTLRVPPSLRLDKQGSIALLQQAKKELETKSPETVAAELKLQHTVKEQLTRREDNAVARAEVNASGVTVDAPRGTYAWKVMSRSESAMPELSRPLQREIASKLIRKRGSSKTVKTNADKLLKKMQEVKDFASLTPGQVQELLGEIDPELTRTRNPGPLTRDPEGFIPGVGTYPDLLESLFKLDAKDNRVLTPPYMTSQYVWLAGLIARNTPERATFDKNKEANMKAFREAAREKIFANRMTTRWEKEYNIERDLTPLRKRYGKLEKH